MSTVVKIENINGPDTIIVQNRDRKEVLLPGQETEICVSFDTYLDITEAELQKELLV